MKHTFTSLFLFFSVLLFSQEDLLSEIDTDNQAPVYASAVFKGLKVINFESTKLVAKGGFNFIVSHRFGTVKNGFENLFGLDEAVTHLNFVYGISDHFNVSASRSSNQKIYELATKFRLARQQEGKLPFTMVGYTSVLANTALDTDNLPKLRFEHRLSYVGQLWSFSAASCRSWRCWAKRALFEGRFFCPASLFRPVVPVFKKNPSAS